MPRGEAKDSEKKKIIETWVNTLKQFKVEGLNEEEKAQIDEAWFAYEQSRKTSFVLGGQIDLR